MLGPRARLALLVVALAAAFVVFAVADVVSKDEVRDWVDAFGPAAPLAYVVLAAVLGALLVPGPLLAGVSGLLFGTALGTAVTLAAAVAGALLELWLARVLGRGAVDEISGPRLQRLAALAERHGLSAVVAQRLAPGIPDAPASYAFGLLGVRTWQIALGTLIGSAPRAFSYTAIGASLDDPASPAAIAGVVVLLLTAVAGAEIARRALRGRAARAPGRAAAPR